MGSVSDEPVVPTTACRIPHLVVSLVKTLTHSVSLATFTRLRSTIMMVTAPCRAQRPGGETCRFFISGRHSLFGHTPPPYSIETFSDALNMPGMD